MRLTWIVGQPCKACSVTPTDRRPPPVLDVGGSTSWAHLEFTPINIELTILSKKIEEPRNTGGWRDVSWRMGSRRVMQITLQWQINSEMTVSSSCRALPDEANIGCPLPELLAKNLMVPGSIERLLTYMTRVM
jgi:hypothetical protein